jgi:hypothetical protein
VRGTHALAPRLHASAPMAGDSASTITCVAPMWVHHDEKYEVSVTTTSPTGHRSISAMHPTATTEIPIERNALPSVSRLSRSDSSSSILERAFRNRTDGPREARIMRYAENIRKHSRAKVNARGSQTMVWLPHYPMAPSAHIQRRAPGAVGFGDVLERVLDRGIVIDALVRVSVTGLDIVTVEARVVVASIETYLHHAEPLHQSALLSRAVSPAARPRLRLARADNGVVFQRLRLGERDAH